MILHLIKYLLVMVIKYGGYVQILVKKVVGMNGKQLQQVEHRVIIVLIVVIKKYVFMSQ